MESATETKKGTHRKKVEVEPGMSVSSIDFEKD